MTYFDFSNSRTILAILSAIVPSSNHRPLFILPNHHSLFIPNPQSPSNTHNTTNHNTSPTNTPPNSLSLPLILHEEIVSARLLLLILLRVHLVNSRSVVIRVASERDRQMLQESVHSRQQALRRLRRALHARLSLVHHHAIGQIGRLQS